MFKDFIEATGIVRKDFSHLPMQDRMAQGRDIGEKFIRDELFRHGVRIVPANSYEADAKMKIDGYLDGNPNEPVQIKLRKTSRNNRNDIAYEVVRNHQREVPIATQLQDIHQQGRDFRGQSVKHYFVLNQNETEIYHIPATLLKSAVMTALKELAGSPMKGILDKPFQSSLGVDLRPTQDNDPASFTPSKVMAFIPAEAVAQQRYTIGQGEMQPTAGAPKPTMMSKKDANVAAADERLKRLQAKQKLANDLRKKGLRGTDDQVIAAAGATVP